MTRIIAGRAKGRRLATPKGANTRPTTDRTREAMFSGLVNWFDAVDADSAQHFDGVAVLDLFAGSGAVGLEAASRGASRVVLVESDKPTARLIKDNAADLGVTVEVRSARVETALPAEEGTFDLVFMDPPYKMTTDAIEAILQSLTQGLLAPRALVVIERSSRERPPQWPAIFTDIWDRRHGSTTLYFGSID